MGRGSASCVHVCGDGAPCVWLLQTRICVWERMRQIGDIYCMCCQLILGDLFGSCMICVCERARVLDGYHSTLWHRVLHRVHQSSTGRHRENSLWTGFPFFFLSLSSLFSPLPLLNLQLMQSKAWWQPVMKAWKHCVVFYYLPLTNRLFYDFACVDGFQWISIDKLDHCGRAKPLCHPLINGNQWII